MIDLVCEGSSIPPSEAIRSLDVFDEGERRVILEDPDLKPADYPHLAKVKRMSASLLRTYDQLVLRADLDEREINDFARVYDQRSAHWADRECNLLRQRLARRDGRWPTEQELQLALTQEILGYDGVPTQMHRFRAYMALKYPYYVEGHRELHLPKGLQEPASACRDLAFAA